MALKTTIDSTTFASLNDVLKAEYKLQADGTYSLDLGGMFVTDKDPAGLFSALEKEREELKRVKTVADALEAEKKAAELKGITGIEELKAHFEQELAAMNAKAEAEKQQMVEQQKAQKEASAKSQLQTKALEIAASLFGKNAPLMLPHVQSMLKANTDGDAISIEIVDPLTGKPSIDQNFDNFKKSLSTNELFKPMIVVSNASGGSANDGKSSGVPSATTADGKPKTYSDYTPSELLALKRTNPEVFTSLQSTKG